jgi:hypothetical protein
MSERVVITPNPLAARPRTGEPVTPEQMIGRLAAALLSVAVAGAAEGPRFRRGKEYAADGTVQRLEVSAGTLKALVSGSRGAPYEAVISVPLLAALTTATLQRSDVNRLAPPAEHLLSSCTCPDWDDPCKHAIAALLVFGEEIANRPELLVLWRTSGVVAGERARVGSRAGQPDQSAAPVALDADGDETPSSGLRLIAGLVGDRRGASTRDRDAAGNRRSSEGIDRRLRLVEVPTPKQVDPHDSDEWREFLGHTRTSTTPRSALARAVADIPDTAPVVGEATLDRVDVGDNLRHAQAILRRVLRRE